MDQPRDQAPAAPGPTESQSPQLVSRRRLLKILAAGGGAVVASALLPETWATPAVQALPPMVLTSLQVSSGRMASFNYSDPEAEVDDDHTYLWTRIDNASDGFRLLRDRAAAGLVRSGNAQNGTIRFPLWTTGNWPTNQLCVQMLVTGINGSERRYSDALCCWFEDDKTPTSLPPTETVTPTPTSLPPTETVTPTPTSTPSACTRADLSAIIYGGWNGILVSASVGGTPQPTLATALDAWGRPAVLWTLYPPEGASWTVVVTPQLPAGLDPARWKFEPASASVAVAGCSEAQVTFQLVDTGAKS